MNEEKKQRFSKEKIISLIIITVLVLSITTSAYIIYYKPQNKENKITFTTSYTNVTAREAYDIFNESINLTIIDCRTCACNWRSGHIPGAVHNLDPEDYINWTNDILVYGDSTSQGASFCEGLINIVYSEIYCLLDGFKSWENAGYPIEKA